MSNISSIIKKINTKERAAFIAYFILGLPDLEKSIDYIIKCSDFYDIVEIGIPFTDPIADGSTIQEGSQVALKNNYSMNDYFDAIKKISFFIKKPIVLMLYYNQVFGYGIDKFIKNCLNSNVSGLIIPDVLPESDKEFIIKINKTNIDLIFIATPVTKEKRINHIIKKTRGFLYLTSVVGITGERESFNKELKAFCEKIRILNNSIPVCVGFGISTSEQVKEISSFADGVIVGSAIVRKIINKENPEALIKEMYLNTVK